MDLYFKTPTKLSLLDLSSMGDSSKRGDSNTIGQFDSGLKYAIALLLRNDVNIKINTTDDEFTFSTTKQSYEDGKEKELIVVHSKLNGDLVTGFAKQLGYNWELYMAFRELYSNMLDENGEYSHEEHFLDDGEVGTIIKLSYEDGSVFDDVIKNKHLYINEDEPLFKISNKLDLLENEEEFLRIYKNNILVYEDRDFISKYAYNISFGEIDERRILSNIWSVKNSIAYEITESESEEFAEFFVTKNKMFDDKDFINGLDYYGVISDNSVLLKRAEELGDFHTAFWLQKSILKNPKVNLKGKQIQHQTIYRPQVVVETIPKEILVEETSIDKSFSEKVNEMYKIDISNICIKEAKLSGSKAIADKYNNCIIIDEEFSLESDFHKFVVEYYILTEGDKGNIIDILSKNIVKLLAR